MNGSSGDAAATAGAISGLSHITLLAPSRQLWQKTLQFYNTLGLPTVSLGGRPSSRAESLPGVLANGNGSAEETEAWLHVFAATPESEVSIRLALAQEGTEQPTDEAENYLEKLQERSRALDRNEISTELVTFNFTVVNLHAIQGILRTLDSPNLRVNHNSIDMAEPAHSELFAYDPLGNLLCFSTSSRSPFAKPAKVSAMLSPAVQVPTTVVQQAPRRRKRIGIMTSGGDSSGSWIPRSPVIAIRLLIPVIFRYERSRSSRCSHQLGQGMYSLRHLRRLAGFGRRRQHGEARRLGRCARDYELG